MVRLSIYREGEAVLEHPLPRGQTSLGRQADNDVVLDDLALSRHHARIDWRADHHVVVDLGSQNGVYLNGERIIRDSRLKPGDRIGIGRYVGVYDQDVSQRLEPLPSEGAHSEISGQQLTGPRLTLVFNGTEMDRFPLQPLGYVIGRSHRCDIVIGVLGLSRRHARVFQMVEGDWAVEDLGSQNGTFVNDKRINGMQVLHHGDTINFFDYSLIFQTETQEDPDSTGKDIERPPPEDVTLPPGFLETGSGAFQPPDLAAAAAFEAGGPTDLDAGALGHSAQPLRRTLSLQRARMDSYAESPSVAPSWPSDADVETALMGSTRAGRVHVVEVLQDGRLLTEVPLDKASLRVGSDPRCDVALPPLTAIAGWHLTLVRNGETVLLCRMGDAPPPRVDGRPVLQAFLRDGNEVELGRITLRCRLR